MTICTACYMKEALFCKHFNPESRVVGGMSVQKCLLSEVCECCREPIYKFFNCEQYCYGHPCHHFVRKEEVVHKI